MVEKYSRWLS